MICSLDYSYKGGCDKNIFAERSVANHFAKRKSDEYLVILDTFAAFDRSN